MPPVIITSPRRVWRPERRIMGPRLRREGADSGHDSLFLLWCQPSEAVSLMQKLAVLLALFLAGCGTVVASQPESFGNGEHRLHYEYGAVDSLPLIQDALAGKASELCPDGWIKTRERRIERGGILAPTYQIDIRCVPPATR